MWRRRNGVEPFLFKVLLVLPSSVECPLIRGFQRAIEFANVSHLNDMDIKPRGRVIKRLDLLCRVFTTRVPAGCWR